MPGTYSRSAHLNMARHPFIENHPRSPLVFKALRVMVVGNYPGEDITSRKAFMEPSQVYPEVARQDPGFLQAIMRAQVD